MTFQDLKVVLFSVGANTALIFDLIEDVLAPVFSVTIAILTIYWLFLRIRTEKKNHEK